MEMFYIFFLYLSDKDLLFMEMRCKTKKILTLDVNNRFAKQVLMLINTIRFSKAQNKTMYIKF